MNDVDPFGVHIRALMRPLVGLDLDDGDHRALVAVAGLDATTATTSARLLSRVRQARPLRIRRS
jgi:hypothetical protein